MRTSVRRVEGHTDSQHNGHVCVRWREGGKEGWVVAGSSSSRVPRHGPCPLVHGPLCSAPCNNVLYKSATPPAVSFVFALLFGE